MNRLCKLTGAEFPLFAFSHCRDVVAAVSRAGGFGVLGASSHTPDTLDAELRWIVEHCAGRPFGVDILFPEHVADIGRSTPHDLAARIPDRHRRFVADLLAAHGIEAPADEIVDTSPPKVMPDQGEVLLDIAFSYPIRLIANALGIAPPRMIELGRRHDVPVAALVGAREHALRQADAGVDIVVAQGGEAAGHCGDVSTLVLVPEVVRALEGRDIPVIAAGGIATGDQMAACMAMGAQGAWTGTVWLATAEAETSEAIRARMLAATSRDTVRSKARTGKPSRQLRSEWHRAWEAEGAPEPLPMPLMGMISEPAFRRIGRANDRGEPGAEALDSYFVGQGVGLIEQVRSAGAVVQTFKEEFVEALERLTGAFA